MATASADSWQAKLLRALGAPVTAVNVQALTLWQNSEGTDPVNNNWLATTLKKDPSSGWSYPTKGIIAKNGGNAVPAYADPDTGVAATAATLRHYPAVVAALKGEGDTDQQHLGRIAAAVNGSTWCKGCQKGNYPYALVRAAGGQAALPAKPAVDAQGKELTAADGCLIKVPVVGCVFSRSQGRAVLGALVLVSGGVVMLGGVALMAAYGLQSSAARRVLQTAGAPSAALQRRNQTATAASERDDLLEVRGAEREARMKSAEARHRSAEARIIKLQPERSYRGPADRSRAARTGTDDEPF